MSGHILCHWSRKQDALPSLHRVMSLWHVNLNISLVISVCCVVMCLTGILVSFLIGLREGTNYSYLSKPSPEASRPPYLRLGIVSLTGCYSHTAKSSLERSLAPCEIPRLFLAHLVRLIVPLGVRAFGSRLRSIVRFRVGRKWVCFPP